MVTLKNNRIMSWLLNIFVFGLSFTINTACAIDNPDAPDYVGNFEKSEKSYLIEINNPKNGSRDYLIAYDNYQQFLDKELNKAYKQLKSKLSAAQQEQLKQSQRNWINFRDAEFKLIKNSWTRQNFGSSAGISRGEYKCKVIKDRALQLMDYAKNY